MADNFIPLKITLHLDGTGVHYNAWEPPHLDAVLAWLRLRFVLADPDACIQRDDVPENIPLPLNVWSFQGVKGFCASAFFPAGESVESLLMWRKKFNHDRVEHIGKGSPNMQNGPYREYNVPLPLLLCHRMEAWAMGNRSRIRKDLRRLQFLGKKRGLGRGRVVGCDVEPCENDYSLVKDGLAMRWLPKADGARLVRSRPPYWNNHGRVPCCEVLEPYSLRGRG